MATKKAGSTAKKKTTTKVKSTTAKPSTTTTKVTTVKAAAGEAPTTTAATASPRFNHRVFVLSALIAEFIGTFLLTIAFMGTKGDPLYLGFALTGIVLIIGTISGSHVNPAVTFGAWVTRKITTYRALGYIVAQVLGATLAFTVLNIFIQGAPQPDAQSAQLGQTAAQIFKAAPVSENSQLAVFFIELIAATIFAFAFASARRTVELSAKALTIGLGLVVAGIFGTIAAGYLQANAAFNPAIALAIQAVDWSKINFVVLAAYMIAPLLGGVIGFALRDFLAAGEKKV